MDILRVLSSPDLEVRKKTLSLVLDLVNSRNVEEVRPFSPPPPPPPSLPRPLAGCAGTEEGSGQHQQWWRRWGGWGGWRPCWLPTGAREDAPLLQHSLCQCGPCRRPSGELTHTRSLVGTVVTVKESLPIQLLEFLSDSDEPTAEDVLVFVREAIQRYPQLKGNVAAKLLEVFPQIKSVK